RGGEAASNGTSAEQSSASSRTGEARETTAEPSPSPREDGDATEGEPFLTVEGANAYPPERNVVTVDAGAISFVSDGADVMRPGIVEADDSIAAGDLVAINEEGHGKFLAVGRAKTDGDDMVGDSGKVVESVHHVGDDLFEFSV
ncbi:RNA-binding protein, partial [Halobacteriales archaeon QS_9_67_15]